MPWQLWPICVLGGRHWKNVEQWGLFKQNTSMKSLAGAVSWHGDPHATNRSQHGNRSAQHATRVAEPRTQAGGR